MKKVTMALFAVVMVAVSLSVWAQNVSYYYEAGDKGYFMYQPTDKQFFVNPNKDFTGMCWLFGEITPETRITVINRKISRENLDLLTGKLILAYGKFKETGSGESSRTACLELNIFILSESGHKIAITPPSQK